MKPPLYIVVGRSRDCDLVLRDPSVSGRHARLSWRGDRIRIEDLGSANGTWVDGDRVRRSDIRAGAQVRLGNATLQWSDPGLSSFLRRGARGDTLLGVRIPGRRFICGSCGARGIIPPDAARSALTCGSCGVELSLGKKRRAGVMSATLFSLCLLAAALGVAWFVVGNRSVEPLRRAVERLRLAEGMTEARAGSPQERSIRARVAPRVVEAIDPLEPATRNAAVRLAAEDEGPFRVEQVARIWSHVRGRWSYVNDPRGDEYFATASQTIENDYAGDCDDFAIVLSSMVESIGGESRIVMLDGEQGGHAYAEVCIREDPQQVASRLAIHYRRNWDRYIGRRPIGNIHFRNSEACPVWLNLDWNARVPGGPYGLEYWAVAIYPDGRTETLAPNTGGEAAEEGQAGVRASALPSRRRRTKRR